MTAKWAVLFSAILLGGCVFTSAKKPLVDAPEVNTPENWQQLSNPADLSDQGWLQDFADASLKQLIAEAISHNPDLQSTRARLLAGLAEAEVAGADLKPQVDAELGASRSRRSSNGRHSISDNVDGRLAFSWELDLWNKLSDSQQGAALAAGALRQDLTAARLSLAANTAKAWFTGVEASIQLRLSEELVANLEKNLGVLEEGYGSGIIDALDIHLARANLAAEQGRLAVRKQAVGDSSRDLELLLGRYPAGQVNSATELPSLPAPVPAGLPSALLERRPDIRAAALRFDRSLALLSRAHKDRFPSLRLSGDVGINSDNLADFLKGNSLIWTALASLTQPLFDGGRLEALEKRTVAEAEEARAKYLSVVLQAFSEVESALQQEQQLLLEVAALNLASEQSDFAESLAFEQYLSGLVDYITVLEAQRRAFNARSTYLNSRNLLLQNRINLYLALGGDFMAQQTNTDLDSTSVDAESAGQALQGRGSQSQ
ncbi:MAG: efflux transporter outer membrane subunit [Motiliproteus sp.]